jgi:MFS family permease
MEKKMPRFPHKLLIAGICIFLVGGILLLWSLGYLPILTNLWPLPIMILGLGLLYVVYLKGKTERFILPGMVLTLSGLFFLLYNTIIPIKDLANIWPFFMIIAGLSLFPYAHKKRGKRRLGINISGILIIVLALIFLPFSLGFLNVSFLEFMLDWWPVIFMVIGLVLVVIYFIRKVKTSSKKEADEK